MPARLPVVSSVFLIIASGLRAAEPASTPEFFEKKIRPVLVEHCHKCHGDLKGKEPKGGLRADSRIALLKGGDNGPALVPGEPDKSKFIEAIRFKNVDLQMPPKGKLPDAVIADLEAWVKAGAVWPNDSGVISETSSFDLAKRKAEHWAWQPVRATNPPNVKDHNWPSGPIDRFILAKLEGQNLKPAAPADRRVWLRRVTFDLTGLPPTPAEVEAFLAGNDSNAKSEVVERLLASPRFGERWARHWLDLVRYAETRGHEFDATIPNAHQYRDYVIRALNLDVPYDLFVHEHVAGDLLPKPRRHPTERFNESVLGTGFWFLGEEVHSPVDIRQDQADRFDNRIDVLTKTFLAMTVSCARCHDHKFDAISTKDYYAIFGFLESSTYRQVRFDAFDHNRKLGERLDEWSRKSAKTFAAELAAAAEPMTIQAADYLFAVREAMLSNVGEIAKKRKLDESILKSWLDAVNAAKKDRSHPLHLWASVAALDYPKRLADAILAARKPMPKLPDGSQVVVDYASNKDWFADEGSFRTKPVRPGYLLTDSRIRFADYSAAEYDPAWDHLREAPGSEHDVGALGRKPRAGRTLRTPNFRVAGKVHYLVRGAGTAYAAVDGHTLINGPLHGQLVIDLPQLATFRWVTHDLSAYKGHPAHIEFTPTGSDFAVAMVVQNDTMPPAPVAEAFMPAGRVETTRDLANAYEKALQGAIERIKKGPPATAIDARIANMLLILTEKKLEKSIAELRSEREHIAKELKLESRLAPAMWDGNGVNERVFIRGSPKGLGDEVPRRFLEALAGRDSLPAESGSGRLKLARQMTDPATNPLIARVFVNRVWHHLFGRGLVASTDNFGKLGELPTHPELLDYLADRFVRDGWSLKNLVRELVLSSTYSMSTQSDAAQAADAQNSLLHRARLRRLEGEAIRDAMLAVSGRLDEKMSGPPIAIHLTPFLDGRGRPKSSGPIDGEGRRSVYLGVRRNFLNPMLLAFDTPIPFSTVGRRQVSNVPAQALILLNDPFVQQQAEVWAKKLRLEEKGIPNRIRSMYRAAFARDPRHDEVVACIDFIKEQAARYGTNDDDLRVWKDLAHTLFNTKEFIYID